MPAKKTFTTVLVLLAIVVAVAAGLAIGKKQGNSQAEEKFGGLIDLAYPKPAAELYRLSGIVKGVFGATIDLEIVDPDDYLPHPDGTPQKKEIRFATVTSATEISLTDYTQPGYPETETFMLSGIKVGDAVNVRSEQNIRDAEKFDATEIEVVRY
jgi:hypothetical protein